jgi:hypothetical protein
MRGGRSSRLVSVSSHGRGESRGFGFGGPQWATRLFLLGPYMTMCTQACLHDMALQGLLLLFHLMTRVCGPPMRRSAPRERLKRRRRGRGSWRGGVGVEWTAPRLRDGSCRCACGRPAVAIRPGGQAVARPSRSHSPSRSRSRSRARRAAAITKAPTETTVVSSPPACLSSRNSRAGDGRRATNPSGHSLMTAASTYVYVSLSLVWTSSSPLSCHPLPYVPSRAAMATAGTSPSSDERGEKGKS